MISESLISVIVTKNYSKSLYTVECNPCSVNLVLLSEMSHFGFFICRLPMELPAQD